MGNKLQTPKDIITFNPEIKFTQNELGTLLSMGLVKGVRKSYGTFIDIDSVMQLCEYRKKLN